MRSEFDDDEFRRNYEGFEYVRALYALDHGWTGQGVLVGVVDDGVLENAELGGQLSGLSKGFGDVTTAGKTTARNVVGDEYSDHGTLIAGVIAGRDDGTGIQGIAPGSKIVALRVSDVDTNTKEETLGRTLPAALDYAATSGIKIVNASLAKVDASQPSAVWSNMVARYATAGGLFVNSTGNDSEANAKGNLDLNDANRNGWLFVTAVEEAEGNLTLASYANHCGATAMARCVSAMGTNATMDTAGRLVAFSGTSSAAAQVSGVAALILSKWPQLSGVQAGQIILNTARDLGDAGVDPIYGAGLIDVDAALSPVAPTISNGTAQTSLTQTAMVIPDAIGGAQTRNAVKLMLSNVTLLDAFGRDYSGNLASLLANPKQRKGGFARQVMASAGAGSTSFSAPGISANLGYTSFRAGSEANHQRSRLASGTIAANVGRTRMIARFSGQEALQDEAMGLAPASDVTIAYAPGANISFGFDRQVAGERLSFSGLTNDGLYGKARGALVGWASEAVRIKVGYLTERGTLFGTPLGSGPLRFGDGARTAFLELSRTFSAGDWSLDTYASVGATRLKIGTDTLLTSADTILTQRAGLSASRSVLDGRVRFGMAMPLVAFAGSGELTYASGYDLGSRSLHYSHQRVGLNAPYAPVMSLGYERLGHISSLRLAAAANTAASDWRALASWQLALR